jgi:hypothetical protein
MPLLHQHYIGLIRVLGKTIFQFSKTILRFVYLLRQKKNCCFHQPCQMLQLLGKQRALVEYLFWWAELYRAWHNMTGYCNNCSRFWNVLPVDTGALLYF